MYKILNFKENNAQYHSHKRHYKNYIQALDPPINMLLTKRQKKKKQVLVMRENLS